MISGYVVIGITFTWARGTSGVRAVSPTRTIFTDDYLEARKAAGDIEVVRTNILDLLNRLDNDILMKEVGNPDGKIHQRND